MYTPIETIFERRLSASTFVGSQHSQFTKNTTNIKGNFFIGFCFYPSEHVKVKLILIPNGLEILPMEGFL